MTPDSIIIHTAAFDGDADIEEVRRWHLLRGFSDVGYHWYIRRDGELQKGREENVQGAHCRAGGMNSHSLGICCEGNGDKKDFTAEQKVTLMGLYEDIQRRWDISVENVWGHRDFESEKTCPGVKVDMDEIRRLLQEPHKFEPLL